MFEKTPAQKLGLPKSPQKRNTTLFETMAWLTAWAILGVGVFSAIVLIGMASDRVYGGEDCIVLAIGSLISGALGFVICGGTAKIIEHLSAIEQNTRN